jgi:hypothetical protein
MVGRSTNNNYQTFLPRLKPQAKQSVSRPIGLAQSTKKTYEPFPPAGDQPTKPKITIGRMKVAKVVTQIASVNGGDCVEC